jgi:hypothetical protein
MRQKNVGGRRLLQSALTVLAMTLMSSCAKKEGSVDGFVEGQVFAVLVSGESLKLAGIAISVHQKDKVDSIIATRKADAMRKAESLRASLKTLENQKSGLQRQVDASRKAVNAPMPPAALIRENPSALDEWRRGTAAAEARYGRQMAAVSDLNGKINVVMSSILAATSRGPLYDDISSPLEEALSDADGNFAINVPRSGDYYIIAKFSRSTFGREETLRWVIPLSASAAPKRLLLSNSNALSD